MFNRSSNHNCCSRLLSTIFTITLIGTISIATTTTALAAPAASVNNANETLGDANINAPYESIYEMRMHGSSDADGNVKDLYVSNDNKSFFAYNPETKTFEMDKKIKEAFKQGETYAYIPWSTKNEIAALARFYPKTQSTATALTGIVVKEKHPSATWTHSIAKLDVCGATKDATVWFRESQGVSNDKREYLLIGECADSQSGKDLPVIVKYSNNKNWTNEINGTVAPTLTFVGISATRDATTGGFGEILATGQISSDDNPTDNVIFYKPKGAYYWTTVKTDPIGNENMVLDYLWTASDKDGHITDVFATAAQQHYIRRSSSIYRCVKEDGKKCSFKKWELGIDHLTATQKTQGVKDRGNKIIGSFNLKGLWGAYDQSGKVTRVYAVGSEEIKYVATPIILVFNDDAKNPNTWRRVTNSELPFQSNGYLHDVWGTANKDGVVQHLFVVGNDHTTGRPGIEYGYKFHFDTGKWERITIMPQ
jgi:hypothetical protein